MHRGTHFFGCIKSFLKPSKSGSLDPVDDEPGLFPPHVRSYGHKDGVTRRPVSNAERGITQEHAAHSLPAAPRQPPADRHPGEPRLPPSPSCSGSALSPAPGRPTASGHTRAGPLNCASKDQAPACWHQPQLSTYSLLTRDGDGARRVLRAGGPRCKPTLRPPASERPRTVPSAPRSHPSACRTPRLSTTRQDRPFAVSAGRRPPPPAPGPRTRPPLGPLCPKGHAGLTQLPERLPPPGRASSCWSPRQTRPSAGLTGSQTRLRPSIGSRPASVSLHCQHHRPPHVCGAAG